MPSIKSLVIMALVAVAAIAVAKKLPVVRNYL